MPNRRRRDRSRVSSVIFDEHYEAARKAGAIGGKLMGAGGGGFFMFNSNGFSYFGVDELTTLWEWFHEQGYDRTTVAQIAGRAGVTKSTFFRHFPDKRDVLVAGQAVMSALLAEGIAAAPADSSPLDAVAAGLRRAAGGPRLRHGGGDGPQARGRADGGGRAGDRRAARHPAQRCGGDAQCRHPPAGAHAAVGTRHQGRRRDRGGLQSIADRYACRKTRYFT